LNPIFEVKKDFANVLSKYFNVDINTLMNYIEYPQHEDKGDLAIPIPKIYKKDQKKLEDLENIKTKFINKIKIEKIFINGFINESELFKLVFSNLNEEYGLIKVEKPLRYIVEHTSANPIHPLHLGHLRNAVLGDAISRLLKSRGHVVITRFYVNDVGRQVAILIYGLEKLGYPDPPQNIKVDHWLGLIYAITNVLLEIKSLKESLKEVKDEVKYKENIRSLDELVIVAKELNDKAPEIFDKLSKEVMRDDKAELRISEIIRLYERGDEDIKKIVRKYVNLALEGFIHSLLLLDIKFDDFDYESKIVWSEYMNEVLQRIKSSKFSQIYRGTIALILNELEDSIRESLRIPKGLEIPPLVVVRADGSTLYTVRDIAYSIYKFRKFNSDKVINVIAEQQFIPQIQLRAALYILGYEKFAENLIHYSYGMVNVSGMKMSGRLGKYVTFDELYKKFEDLALQILEEKNMDKSIIKEVINSAIRYSILSVSPNKPITFDIKSALDLNQNSGPYLLYTYARAYNILVKASDKLDFNNVDFSDLAQEKRTLLLYIAKFPETFIKVSEELRPEDLLNFLRNVADIFNKWYDRERILQEPNERKRVLRLFIVKGVERVLHNGLTAIGIKPLKRM
jgi:arginyl-tRNA synthetase